MLTRGAMTINPDKTNQTIPAGYHNGSGVVPGDPNLVAGNIKVGVNLFNVTRTLVEGKALPTINPNGLNGNISTAESANDFYSDSNGSVYTSSIFWLCH